MCTTSILRASRPSKPIPERQPQRWRQLRGLALRKYCSSPSGPLILAQIYKSLNQNRSLMVMWCREPVTRTPARGLSLAYFRRIAISPGISCSAMEISFCPHSARARSATLYSAAAWFSVAVIYFEQPPQVLYLVLDMLMGMKADILKALLICPEKNPTRARLLMLLEREELSVADGTNPGERPEPDLDSLIASQAGRISGRPADREEHLLPLERET